MLKVFSGIGSWMALPHVFHGAFCGFVPLTCAKYVGGYLAGRKISPINHADGLIRDENNQSLVGTRAWKRLFSESGAYRRRANVQRRIFKCCENEINFTPLWGRYPRIFKYPLDRLIWKDIEGLFFFFFFFYTTVEWKMFDSPLFLLSSPNFRVSLAPVFLGLDLCENRG